ncbi:MAG: tetratricopeptide repeat protein [Bacteroidota bacterium]|nr:tetratricopeptide repeat protein [Bacteroidota bacterium]
MKKLFAILVIFTSFCTGIFFLNGCASSDEATEEGSATPTPSKLDLAQQKTEALAKENAQLKQQITRFEQDVRNLTAKAAQLETQLVEEKEKIKTPAPPPQPAPTRTQTLSEPTKPVIKEAESDYQIALDFFKKKNYKEAITKLQGIIDGGARKDLEDNCYYWMGEANFGMKNYQAAIEFFEKVFNYKISEKKDDAAIMIANSHWEMGNKQEAIKEYKKFIEKFPASPYNKRAKSRISK